MPDKSQYTSGKNQNPGSAGFGMDPDVQSSYDADDFLYNYSAPIGDYPEVTADAIRNKAAQTSPRE